MTSSSGSIVSFLNSILLICSILQYSRQIRVIILYALLLQIERDHAAVMCLVIEHMEYQSSEILSVFGTARILVDEVLIQIVLIKLVGETIYQIIELVPHRDIFLNRTDDHFIELDVPFKYRVFDISEFSQLGKSLKPSEVADVNMIAHRSN